jgi:hypothetical protein
MTTPGHYRTDHPNMPNENALAVVRSALPSSQKTNAERDTFASVRNADRNCCPTFVATAVRRFVCGVDRSAIDARDAAITYNATKPAHARTTQTAGNNRVQPSRAFWQRKILLAYRIPRDVYFAKPEWNFSLKTSMRLLMHLVC